MKKKKKAFTLIELLAVIVVLAIVALIATPIIMDLIGNTQKEAAKRSAENYASAVETAIATARLQQKVVEDGTYKIDSDGNLCLTGNTCNEENKIVVETKGDHPKKGTIVIVDGAVAKKSTEEKNATVGSYSLTYSDKTVMVVGNYKVTYSADATAVSSVLGCGDANDDGVVDEADVQMYLDYLSGYEVSINIEQADTTRDGKINNRDVIEVINHINGTAGYEVLPR
ncbi:MAG: prepilin-type N-terminal cleavage/methylation domain-containing protein [Firmicutes bacterium]|nr:prepilin-type N-terminal cleavage/methylation domain-containing protein [Bacillota bacterium]